MLLHSFAVFSFDVAGVGFTSRDSFVIVIEGMTFVSLLPSFLKGQDLLIQILLVKGFVLQTMALLVTCPTTEPGGQLVAKDWMLR